MKTKIAVALAMLVLAGTASGARWKPVNITPERALYIDMEALVRIGNKVQAWDWQKFGSAQTAATGQGTYFWVKSLTNYHCILRTTDPVLRVYFAKDGTEIRRTQLEGLQFPAAVEPDSLREKMLEMACNPPKPAVKPIALAALKPATDTMVDAKSDAPAPKTDMPASKDKPAAKADPPKPADKPSVAAKPEPAAATPPAPKPPAQLTKRVAHPAYSRPVRMSSKRKPAGGLKLAKAKAQPDPKCPPPGQAGASSLTSPASQFTDAGNDGMFN